MAEGKTALSRHALGLDGKRKRSHRNYFVTGPGSSDYEEWKYMVSIGDAVRFDGKNLQFGGDDLFKLTFKGANAVLREGETLDPEDFPNDRLD